MLIEDPDAFNTWLTAVLKPICEADPAALAKYVIALVKKDKREDLLRQSMVSQLEVFLQTETQQFVNQLFKTLDSQDYITPVIPNANPPNPNIVKSECSTPTKAPLKPVIPVSEFTANLTEPNINDGKALPTIVKEEKIVKDPVVEPVVAAVVKKEVVKKVEAEKDEKTVRRRSRHRSLSRNRTRSRSWDRTRRSRSRDKSRERERLDREKRDRTERGVRSWRNKSPPRRYERRRSQSPGGRARSRSRSPRHNYRGRCRNRSPPLRSNSRSRSRSQGDRRDRKDSRGNEPKDRDSSAGTPTQDNNLVGDVDLRLTTQSVQSAVVQTGAEPSRPQTKRRCRDYDEKGFCMRGEMCPYDHGVDPVVLEDTALSRVLYAPNGTNDNMLVPPPVIPGANLMHMRPSLPAEYNPQAPQMWQHRPPGFRGGHRGGINVGPPRVPPMGQFPCGNMLPNMQQRELISVPVLDSGMPPKDQFNFQQQPPHGPPQGYHHQDGGMFKKKPFDYNRLGPRNHAKNPVNCSLELKKVPPGLNNIMHLNNHFSKFGKIVNIQVYYENDPEAAIVTFSSHAEANAAYRSTEAVLNNRFIKVFWHAVNNEAKQENVPPRPIKERLGPGSNVAPNTNKVLNLMQPKAAEKENSGEDTDTSDKAAKPDVDNKKEEIKAQATLAIKKSQELLAAKEKLKKNQEEKRKEALKLTQDLRKRKQELLEKQLAQQKLLIEKMEKCAAGAQRDLLMQTIKKSQESIEAIRKDLSQSVLTMKPVLNSVPNAANIALMRKSKEEAQKELLDVELDLISKQAEGADTLEIQKKLWELKARVGVAGVIRRGRGARRYNHVSRHLLTKNNLIGGDKSLIRGHHSLIKKTSPAKPGSYQTHAVDHRPTRLLVSGYESDEQQSVLTHFGQFGEIAEYVTDAATPSVVLNYKTRKEAEIAILKGKNFQDRTLSVTWCNNIQLSTQLSGRSSTRTVLISESDEDNLIDAFILRNVPSPTYDLGPELSEEALLQDDEEEDEENEDRSWRR